MLRFDNISNWPRTMIMAHRGAGHSGPGPVSHENTIEAFEAAIAAGADAIELDLRRTRNGMIVVHHDAQLENMKWSIEESPIEIVRDSAERLGYQITTLQETLKYCAGKIALDIELKETGYEEEIVNMTSKYFDLANVVFTSFLDIAIKRIKEYKPQAITGLLLGVEPPAGARKRMSELFPNSRIKACRADFVAPNWRLLKIPGYFGSTHDKLPAITWTLNDKPYARKLVKREIAGIITDVPELILPLVNKHE